MAAWGCLVHACSAARPMPALRPRVATASLATVGLADTGYLSYVKASGAEAFCPLGADAAATCGDVLASSYGSVHGVPLPYLGFAAYAAILALAVVPWIRASWTGTSTAALHAVTTISAVFSVYLVFILATILHVPCIYCLLSAVVSIGTFIAAHMMAGPPEWVTSVGGALGGALVAIAFVDGDARAAPAEVELYRPPAIVASSSREALDVAALLRARHARMFGAYWCSHCLDQKEALGREAFSTLDYVECARDGADSRAEICRARGVPGFPTWEIGGRLYPGEKSVPELQRLLTDQTYAREKEFREVPEAPGT